MKYFHDSGCVRSFIVLYRFTPEQKLDRVVYYH